MLGLDSGEGVKFSSYGSENIDPTGLRTDAELNDALKLITAGSTNSQAPAPKFRLDSSVSAEGSNLSTGERQLREWCPDGTITLAETSPTELTVQWL